NRMAHDFLEDIPKINRWAAASQTDPTAPLPELTSPRSWELVNQIQLRNAQSTVARESSRAFADRVKALGGLSPELAGQFTPFIGRIPTPEVLDRLAGAEVQARSQQREAMTEPLKPGEKRQVKIGGVTYTAQGEKPVSEVQLDLEQQKIDLRKQEMELR